MLRLILDCIVPQSDLKRLKTRFTMATTSNHSATLIEPGDMLTTLKPSSLYILLYCHPNPDIKYHWGLYHHCDSTSGGWKFDIINPGGIWKLAFPYGGGTPKADILDPDPIEPLGVAVRIGELHGKDAHDLIRAEDERLNKINRELDGGVNCRVYVMRACERLKECGWLKYQDWNEIEKDVLGVADANEDARGKHVVLMDSKLLTD